MNLPNFAFTKESLLSFDEVTSREWLITNGLGSYASSTIAGLNTRKYHGLLVAALNPPGDRTICLSKLDEDIFLGNETFRLGTNEFHDAIYPQGFKLLKEFSIKPFPTYSYHVEGISVDKTIFMQKNKNAVSVIYKIFNDNDLAAKLRVYPLLTCRHFHDIVNQSNRLDFALTNKEREVQVVFHPNETTVLCHTTDGCFVEKLNPIENLIYHLEAQRGEASVDNCFQPGFFELQVPAKTQKEVAIVTTASRSNQEAWKVMETIGSTLEDVQDSFKSTLEQKAILLANFYNSHPQVPISDWLNWIILAADSFIVESISGKPAVIAGYPWFESWGRDTFISLPGLLLVTGKYQTAKSIFSNYIQYLKEGLIPNFISDKSGEPAYNTVDATLWYINAVLQYLKYTGDFKFVKDELWEKIKSIIYFHEKGTMFDICLDSDGLLRHGPRLTWMDAYVEGEAVTPRTGKAVEIQALWYNALKIMELLANNFSEPKLAHKYGEMANKTRESFNKKFWNPKRRCLFDVLEAKRADDSIRPNQIFSLSLDFPVLDIEKGRQVVNVVARELVSVYGLRTLAASNSKFIGKYTGDRRSRDTAYHNGSIWPWLIGPFISAFFKIKGHEKATREIIFKDFLLPLFSSTIHQGGLGTINEIYDGSQPHAPQGCISQAWSIAEPLRVYVEDVLEIKSEFSKAVFQF